MSFMYLGRFTRPDLLFPLSVLATRSAAPSKGDFHHAYRIVAYLEATKDLKLVFDDKKELCPTIFADASHAAHASGHAEASR